MRKKCFIIILFLFLFGGLCSVTRAQTSENLVLITLDGFRWQELFNGPDNALLEPETGKADPSFLNEKISREKLMPFMWQIIAKKGFIAGNQELGNKVKVKNRFGFSYPGYNELLTGRRDLRIHSNKKKWNPNPNVLELINGTGQYQNRVSVHSTWDAMPYIVNHKRSKIRVYTAQGKHKQKHEHTGKFANDRSTFRSAMNELKSHRSKVMFVSFDATDEKAHKGQYANYLEAAHLADSFIRQLWEYCQEDPFYKNKTTFIITTDHGRGYHEKWTEHGLFVKGSKNIWLAGIGPSATPEGELSTPHLVYQNQIAAGLLHVLGIKKRLSKRSGNAPENLLTAR